MKLSRDGAIGNLKLFFGNSRADYVSVEDIFTRADRGDYSLESNRKWLYNRLTLIKPYGLYEKVNGIQNGVRVTRGLALTPEGRRAIWGGERPSDSHLETRNLQLKRHVTVRSVLDDVKSLRELYPEFDVIFDIRLRSEDSSDSQG